MVIITFSSSSTALHVLMTFYEKSFILPLLPTNFFLFFLQMVIVGVWITSAIYSCPKFILMDTIVVEMGDGQEEIICAPKRTKYDSELFDIINFVLLYVIPLFIMTVSFFIYLLKKIIFFG